MSYSESSAWDDTASNRAVMAETDEASKRYVRDAVAPAQSSIDSSGFEPALRRLEDRDGLEALAAFRHDWSARHARDSGAARAALVSSCDGRWRDLADGLAKIGARGARLSPHDSRIE